MKGFTGIRDLDIEIMLKLDDRSLINTCKVNKFVKSICDDDLFWKRRFQQSRFNVPGAIRYPSWTYKDHYLGILKDLESFKENPWKFVNELSVILSNEKGLFFNENYIKRDYKLWNLYLYLNLLKKNKDGIVIRFPLNKQLIEKELKGEYISPRDVIQFAKSFYNEPITVEELEQQVMDENPIAANYTIEQVRNGEVKRYNLLTERFERFSGFIDENGVKIMRFDVGWIGL